jgi:putative transcriptional regulator
MSEESYLNNQFIIAMPSLMEPIFHHTVTFLCQHTKEGALGIVINRSAEMKLGEIFKQMDIAVKFPPAAQAPVFSGGPVQQDRGFVVHTACGDWDMTLPVSEDISLTTSRDVIEAIAAGEGPEKYLIALGYAGWGEGQLEQEILSNSWLNTPFAKQILFETPVSQRWNAAASQIGIDINQLTTPAGHC